MSEPNPYDPPREPEALTPATIAKRSLAVGTILALTPLAAGIGGCVSCGVYDALPQVSDPIEGRWRNIVVAVVPLVIILGAMSSWAILAYRRTQKPAGRWGAFETMMVLTPVAVITALAASNMVTSVLVDGIKSLSTVIMVSVATFFGLPLAALIGMLLAAWYILPKQNRSEPDKVTRND